MISSLKIQLQFYENLSGDLRSMKINFRNKFLLITELNKGK